jgi:hypothetical protein
MAGVSGRALVVFALAATVHAKSCGRLLVRRSATLATSSDRGLRAGYLGIHTDP